MEDREPELDDYLERGMTLPEALAAWNEDYPKWVQERRARSIQ